MFYNYYCENIFMITANQFNWNQSFMYIVHTLYFKIFKVYFFFFNLKWQQNKMYVKQIFIYDQFSM